MGESVDGSSGADTDKDGSFVEGLTALEELFFKVPSPNSGVLGCNEGTVLFPSLSGCVLTDGFTLLQEQSRENAKIKAVNAQNFAVNLFIKIRSFLFRRGVLPLYEKDYTAVFPSLQVYFVKIVRKHPFFMIFYKKRSFKYAPSSKIAKRSLYPPFFWVSNACSSLL